MASVAKECHERSLPSTPHILQKYVKVYGITDYCGSIKFRSEVKRKRGRGGGGCRGREEEWCGGGEERSRRIL